MTALEVGIDAADAAALLARQTDVLGQIASGVGLPEVLGGIAATLEDLAPGSACSVLLLDREAAVLRHGAAPSLPPPYCAAIDGLAIGPGAGSCGTAAWSGEAVVVTDIATDTRWDDYRTLAERFGLRACWSTPIRGRDGTCGTFAVYHRAPHRPTAREEQVVERLTHLASVAIDHAAVLGALAASEERFRRAFEDNAVGMALATPAGEITRVNRAMQDLLRCSELELVGRPLDAVVVPRSGCAGKRSYEATARTADGRPLDVAVAVATIRGAHDEPQALSVNVLDVTGRRAAERERTARVEAELARTAAEAANRAKTDFVAALGHELRTPLQAITGFTEVLGTLDLSEARRSAALRHIAAAADHILTMVGDVLDVARIEARALPLALCEVAVGPLVEEVLAMARPLAAASRVELRVATPSPAVRVFADERRVRQVLLNLVTNAVRYNRADGSVCVGWSGDGDRVVLAVCDTGAGIAPEHLDRVFTPFDRLGRDCDEGVGLGLPLARGLAEAMGGTLEVRSAVGEGTTVRLVLPAGRQRPNVAGVPSVVHREGGQAIATALPTTSSTGTVDDSPAASPAQGPPQ